jgi:hypothetical protein
MLECDKPENQTRRQPVAAAPATDPNRDERFGSHPRPMGALRYRSGTNVRDYLILAHGGAAFEVPEGEPAASRLCVEGDWRQGARKKKKNTGRPNS